MFNKCSKSIGIDVSPSSIKVVEAFKKKGDIVVKRADVFDYPISLYKMARDEKNKEIQKILGTILTRKDLKDCKVSVGLSGQSAFLRFMDLPQIDKKKIERIVRYEALQQVPFPLDDVIWDYDLIKRRGQKSSNAVLAAVKKEIANSVLSLFAGIGIEVDFVDVTPLALYGAIEHFDALEKKIILNMGSASTDVLIITKDRVWTRTILMGGNDITNTLAFEMNMSFEEAEKLKIEHALVIAHPKEDNYSPEEVRISNAITPTLVDLLKEVSQSIGYYKSQHKTTELFDKILLTGGASRLMGLDKFFGMHLIVAVEKLDIFKNGKGLNQPDRLGVAFGLALKGAGRDMPADINLLPKEIIASRRFAKRRRLSYYLSAALAALCVLSSLFVSGRIMTYKKQLAGMDRKIARYESDAKVIDAHLSDVEAVENKLAVLENIAAKRKYWLRVLAAINKTLPANAWIEELETKDSNIIIKGHTTANPFDIAGFKNRLKKIKYFKSAEVSSDAERFSARITLKKLKDGE